MVGGLQPPTHRVTEPTTEATANLIESDVTTADAGTLEDNAVVAQTVDIQIPANPLRVPVSDALSPPTFKCHGECNQSTLQEHGAVDAVLTGARSTGEQAVPTSLEVSEPPVFKRFSRVQGPQEIFGTENNGSAYRKVFSSCRGGYESSVADIVERRNTLRRPTRGIPLPTHEESHGTTGELFTQIKEAILEQTSLSNQVSAVLTYWVLSTWFIESLPIAPCLLITGPPLREM
jgi:hypothetical protein